VKGIADTGFLSFCLSERYPKLPVVAVDGDFKVYRRHQRVRIPVLMPGEG